LHHGMSLQRDARSGGIEIFIFAVGPPPPPGKQLLVLALRAGSLNVATCLAKMRPAA
jgi:hypothetical protein